ncbi:CDP-diacylglycerol--serine O-phosphatidyltransferase [Candidatus Woesearchaeota archaeon]|nr:CDP-diacylglycerol--serine O-phosphatidyltransferase [Candidatus Woesearchaeota archaeon]
MLANPSLERIRTKLDQQKLKARQSLQQVATKLRSKRLNIPLVLTCCRLLLSPLIFWAIIISQFQIATLLFFFASLTDALDGYLARRYKMETRLGSLLDPVADKVMVNATTAALVSVAGFPLVVFSLFLLRDLAIILAGIIILRKGLPLLQPTRLSKMTTFFQILAILSFLADLSFWPFLLLALLFTTVSGMDYARKYYLQSNRRIPAAYQFRMLLALPDFFTLANAGCGFLSIIFSIHGSYAAAAVLLLCSAFCDALDGKIARRLHREGSFGREMDSLADILSFGVAPAVFGMAMAKNVFFFPLFFFFLSCGILRLARYNIMEEKGVFYGVPITISGLLIPAMYFLSAPTWTYPWTLLAQALLMIAPIRIGKVSL